MAPAVEGAGVRWTPLPKAEAPTEPAGETRGTSTLVILNKKHLTINSANQIGFRATGSVDTNKARIFNA